MTYPDSLVQLIDERIASSNQRIAQAGTVAERSGNTTAQVQFDGSNLAVPVKVFGDVNIAPGDRVGMLRIGPDWTVIGTFARRRSITMPDGAGTGTQRMVFGGDTPPELVFFGITVAMRGYVTDNVTGLETGYFFQGLSNVMDAGANIRALVYGNVSYPVPGNPDSATASNVKTNFQQQQWAQQARTVFKDHDVWFYNQQKLYLGNEVDSIVRYMTQGTRNEQGISKTANNDTTTSATSVPLNESSFNFTKRYLATEIALEIELSMYVTGTTASVVLGMNIGGVDYDLTNWQLFTPGVRATIPTGFLWISGIAAGNYTPYGYWRRAAGTGTLTRDTNDHYKVLAYEVVR